MNTYQAELYHHGIKGQRWGIRRYQNPDGSLTEAGKKRYNTVQNAAKEYVLRAKSAEEDAKYYRDAAKKAAKRYGGESGDKKWLQDMYGDDWKDKGYMKDVFEIDDVEAHGREGAKQQISDAAREADMMTKQYKDDAKKYLQSADKLMSTPITSLSKSDYKMAEKLAKQYIKSEKRNWISNNSKKAIDSFMKEHSQKSFINPDGDRIRSIGTARILTDGSNDYDYSKKPSRKVIY